MNILFVSRSKEGKVNPFVLEQADSLMSMGNITVTHYLIEKGGIRGYWKAVKDINAILKRGDYSLVHVHYGLSAFAVIMGKLFLYNDSKVVVTFHGSDINKVSERYFSLFASRFSDHNILVSAFMEKFIKRRCSVIPCGIDVVEAGDLRNAERAKRNWSENEFIVLFSSGFDKKVKDPSFAHEVIERFSISSLKKIRFLELKGYSRDELNRLMQAADVLLMCSISEGSPQVVKEAIWNGLPVLSNDVGEVRNICKGVDHCYIVPKDLDSYLKVLMQLADQPVRIKNRNKISEFYNNEGIAHKISRIYSNILFNANLSYK